MMDRESFELEKDAVNWLIYHGRKFEEAVALVSYAQISDRSIFQAFVDFVVEGRKIDG